LGGTLCKIGSPLLSFLLCSLCTPLQVIKDLCKQKINQETIAAMLDISQSTVSNVLRKK